MQVWRLEERAEGLALGLSLLDLGLGGVCSCRVVAAWRDSCSSSCGGQEASRCGPWRDSSSSSCEGQEAGPCGPWRRRADQGCVLQLRAGRHRQEQR